MHELFRKLAHAASEKLGSAWAFSTALGIIMVWAISGPFLDFSTGWQLVINTTTTILTFLMVFLIQNTQNRDARAMHLKLDELIHSIRKARNELIDLEDMSDSELNRLQEEFRRVKESRLNE